ncbi:MAG: hypothetical protein ABIK64_05865 [Bacillota bacterium]
MRSAYAAFDERFPADEESLQSVLACFAGMGEAFAVELRAETKVIGTVALDRIDGKRETLGIASTEYIRVTGTQAKP